MSVDIDEQTIGHEGAGVGWPRTKQKNQGKSRKWSTENVNKVEEGFA